MHIATAMRVAYGLQFNGKALCGSGVVICCFGPGLGAWNPHCVAQEMIMYQVSAAVWRTGRPLSRRPRCIAVSKRYYQEE